MSIKTLLHRLSSKIWANPDLLHALKVLISLTLTTLPLVWFDQNIIGTAVALGIVAAALAESENSPIGRIKAGVITCVAFFICAAFVSISKPFPWIFEIGFIAITFVVIILGGTKERYRSVASGTILIGIYSMLGYEENLAWFIEPLWLTAGALAYIIISSFILQLKPNRSIEEKLALGFEALAEYLQTKSKLFSGENEDEISGEPAIINVKVVSALESCKTVFNIYNDEGETPEKMEHYLQQFMLLQSLHERAAAGFEVLKTISQKPEFSEIIYGFGELYGQLAVASQRVSNEILTGEKYHHPGTISLIIEALQHKIESHEGEEAELLILILHNLKRSNQSISHPNDPFTKTAIPRISSDPRTRLERIKDQLNTKNVRFRFATRVAFSFAVGFVIANLFQPEKGEWILLTTFLVTQTTYSETRQRLLRRVVGTLVGILAGVVLLSLLPTLPGKMLLLGTSVFFFFYYRFSKYAYAVAFITIYVLTSNAITDFGSDEYLWLRVIDTLIGSFLAIISVRILWPDWQHKQLPTLIAGALNNNATYLECVINEIKNQQPTEADDLNYRIIRRQAHLSDNRLTQAWRGMRLEPKKERKFLDQSFTLTYLNHVLISYISTLATERDNSSIFNEKMHKIIEEILQALRLAASKLNEAETEIDTIHLRPILLELREHINASNDLQERQQLRIIYNMADVANRLLKLSSELNRMLKEEKSN